MTKQGFILLDKEIGITSAKALQPIKKRLPKGTKVGHAGTLDPFASGLLIVGVGKATKALQYAVGMHKTYEFSIKWGEATNTDDVTGRITKTSDKIPTMDEILDVMPALHGAIKQKPPKYSAIHVSGKRAYNLARQGVEFDLPERNVEIISLALTSHDEFSASFIVECSKGCYVRSIATDLAKRLGTYGHVTSLRRTKIGKFSVDDATEKIIPILEFLQDFEIISINDDIAKKVINGCPLRMTEMFYFNTDSEDDFIVENSRRDLIAFCSKEGGSLKIERIS